jgi:hypothetical protein
VPRSSAQRALGEHPFTHHGEDKDLRLRVGGRQFPDQGHAVVAPQDEIEQDGIRLQRVGPLLGAARIAAAEKRSTGVIRFGLELRMKG